MSIYSIHNYTIRAPDKTCMSSDMVIYNAYLRYIVTMSPDEDLVTL